MREFELIQEIRKHNRELAACGGAEVLIPPGDDMALVGMAGRRVLIAADQVIGGRHFTTGTSMALVARKALARKERLEGQRLQAALRWQGCAQSRADRPSQRLGGAPPQRSPQLQQCHSGLRGEVIQPP